MLKIGTLANTQKKTVKQLKHTTMKATHHFLKHVLTQLSLQLQESIKVSQSVNHAKVLTIYEYEFWCDLGEKFGNVLPQQKLKWKWHQNAGQASLHMCKPCHPVNVLYLDHCNQGRLNMLQKGEQNLVLGYVAYWNIICTYPSMLVEYELQLF